MNRTPHLWAARIGVSMAAALTVGAAALPAHADNSGFVWAALPFDITIGAKGSPGKAIPVYLMANAHNPSVSFDLKPLAAVADLHFPDTCKITSDTATCALPSDTRFDDRLPVTFVPKAAAGTTVTFTATIKADNASPMTATAQVTLDGVDLVTDEPAGAQLGSAKPGDVTHTPVAWSNVGNKSAASTTLSFGFDNGLAPVEYDGCEYAKEGRRTLVTCRIDEELKPGTGYEFVTRDIATGQETPGIAATVTPDAYGTKAIDFYAEGNAATSSLAVKDLRFSRPAKPTKKVALRAAAAKRKAGIAAASVDIDDRDNFGAAYYDITNSLDLAAIGTTASGQAGDVVAVKLGIRNNGKGSLDSYRSGGEPATYFLVTVPPGTEVTEAPKTCSSITEEGDGTTRSDPGQAGGTYYGCITGTYLGAGETYTVTFKLKITEVKPDATGTVSLHDKDTPPSDRLYDDNPANDEAPVVINPTGTGGGAGGGAGSGGVGSGGVGGGSALPITGTQTAVAAGVGVVLVGGGAAMYLLARRRQVVLVADADDRIA
ncbi:hypothetical protein ACNTMW_17160 [Planosporangium sp. 12N6]|uniref:hypothetical protein n=1 Tax=Planosporangium spinosum TaxID=3402278 RepID=UPI003CEFDB60